MYMEGRGDRESTGDHSEESSPPPTLLDARDRLARDEIPMEDLTIGNQFLSRVACGQRELVVNLECRVGWLVYHLALS